MCGRNKDTLTRPFTYQLYAWVIDISIWSLRAWAFKSVANLRTHGQVEATFIDKKKIQHLPIRMMIVLERMF